MTGDSARLPVDLDAVELGMLQDELDWQVFTAEETRLCVPDMHDVAQANPTKSEACQMRLDAV